MQRQDCEQLTLFQGDSLASLSVSPGSEAARMMTVTSGRRCSESYMNSGPLGYLVRMCLESSIWRSTRCFLTWKTKALPFNRLLFRLAVSMPRIGATECVFWPTPTGSAWGASGHRAMLRSMVNRGLMTQEEYAGLTSGNPRTNPELSEWLMGYTRTFTQLLPTPTASEYRGAQLNRYVGGGYYRHRLCELLEVTPRGVNGRMNPAFLELLMGYPIGWTELEH